jgi:hypothetical protein
VTSALERAHCQQVELYASEAGLPLGADLPLAEAQAFVDAMRETAVWRRQYASVMRVEVRFIESGSASVGGWFPHNMAGLVEMLPGHRNPLILCHEVAHVLASARYGSRSHDPWFARTYLELVWSMMGPDAYAALKAAFDAHAIDHDHDSTIPAGRAPTS